MYNSLGISLLQIPFIILCSAKPGASLSEKNQALTTPLIIARQDTTDVLSATPSSTTAVPSSVSSIVPTGTPTAPSSSLNINKSFVNEPLGNLTVDDDSLSFSCKNCSIFGDLNFGVDKFTIDDSLSNPTWPLAGGILLMNATGFGGTFELDITSGALSKTWDYSFFTQSVLGFGMTDVVNVGVLVELAATFEVEIEEEMDLVFGLDFRVPDGSYINIDVIDPTNSSQKGFSSSTGLRLDAIPFQANFSTPKLTVSMALDPKITFGINVLDSVIKADAGAYIDIPKLSVEVESVTNVDANCRPMNATNHGLALGPDMGNATNVIPSAEIDLGLIAEAGIGSLDDEQQFTLVSAVTTLPTACLLWDKDSSKLADATNVVAASSSASSAASASSASSASAASAAATSATHKHNAGARVGYSGKACFLAVIPVLGWSYFSPFGF
ncbi:MAG: hypothetical protein Q9165_005816 [Trypethelium subeluteriae]